MIINSLDFWDYFKFKLSVIPKQCGFNLKWINNIERDILANWNFTSFLPCPKHIQELDFASLI